MSVYGTVGLVIRLEAFLGSLASIALQGIRAHRHRVSVLKLVARICLRLPPTPLNRDVHHPADLAFCVPSIAQTPQDQYRNINLFPFGYALRPRLRIRLTLS